MKIELGNGYYFLYICIAAFCLSLLILLLAKRTEKTIRVVLLVLLFINFALHYLKQAFPPYINNQPSSLTSSTFETVCAISTVLFPFIYLKKKQTVLHDYVFFIGLCGGLSAIVLPTPAIGLSPFAFETVRFYFCHFTLMGVPLLAAVLGVYRPRLKAFWAVPLLFLAQETIVCLNEFFLIGVGAVNANFADLLNPAFRNMSFAFGLRPDFGKLSVLLDPLVPSFFKTDAFGINGGVPFYFPVLWLTVPAFVYLMPFYALLSSPFWLPVFVKENKEKGKK